MLLETSFCDAHRLLGAGSWGGLWVGSSPARGRFAFYPLKLPFWQFGESEPVLEPQDRELLKQKEGLWGAPFFTGVGTTNPFFSLENAGIQRPQEGARQGHSLLSCSKSKIKCLTNAIMFQSPWHEDPCFRIWNWVETLRTSRVYRLLKGICFFSLS